jgi:hypothetical protein
MGGVNKEVRRFFYVVLLRSGTPSSPRSVVACFPFLYLTLSSSCVMVRACLSQMTGEGGDGPKEDDRKK